MARLVLVLSTGIVLAGCSGIGDLPLTGDSKRGWADVSAGFVELRQGMTDIEVREKVGEPWHVAGLVLENEDLARDLVDLMSSPSAIGAQPKGFAWDDRVPTDPNDPIKVEQWVFSEPELMYVVLGFRNGRLIQAHAFFARDELVPSGVVRDPGRRVLR